MAKSSVYGAFCISPEQVMQCQRQFHTFLSGRIGQTLYPQTQLMLSRLLLLSGLTISLTVCQAQVPDLIIINGKIFTGNDKEPYAEAVSVKADKILAVGKTSDLVKRKDVKTVVIDAGGRLVIPGINDAHDHIGGGIGRYIQFNSPQPAGPAFSVVLDSLQRVAKELPKGTWIKGNIGLDILEDATARRNRLDSISPEHPVMLAVPWGHGTLLNTKAMNELGISSRAADPVGGFYERYANSDEINGLLHEYAGFPVGRQLISKLPDSLLTNSFIRYSAEALNYGITSVQNMATGMEPSQMLRVTDRISFPIRMRIIPFPGTNSQARNKPGKPPVPSPGSMARVSGIKWIIDGTPLERLAVMRHEYADRHSWYGKANFTADTMRAILQEALSSSEQLLLHISGDSTPVTILRLMSQLAGASKWQPKRVRFEHADGVYAEQYPLIRQMGVVAVVNPMHFTFAETNHRRLGKHAARYQPFRSLIEAGVPVAIGSDGPNNPWLNIMFATIHPSNPAEAVTREQALIAYTAGSAYAEMMETKKGKIMPGMLADIVILSQDILTVPREALPATTSMMTMIGGKVLHNKLKP